MLKLNQNTRSQIDLLIQLVKSSFKMRYQNSVLGFLWVLIKPYTMFGVMYAIFSNVVRSNVDNYAVYLLIGIVFISFINELLTLGQMSLLERADVILKVNFSRQIAVISALIGALISLLVNLALVFIVLILINVSISLIGILYLLFVIVTIFIWGTAISFLTSILTVRFRDLKTIIELLMFVLQYATPIFYTLEDDFVPETVRNIVGIMPQTMILNEMRAGLNIYADINAHITLFFFVTGIVALLVCWKYFSLEIKKIAEYF